MRVVVMANDLPGVEVCRFLIANGDQIVRLYLHEADRQKHAPDIVAASGCPGEDAFPATLLKNPAHVAGLNALAPDYILTIYWSHILSEEVIRAAVRGTVNFHPAMLPVNRGWYPQVHTILDGSPSGVTLHVIDKLADRGPIWAQKEVPLQPSDTAFTLHQRLQREIVALFKETWPKIVNGQIQPATQDESKAVYHKKAEVDNFDRIALDSTVRVGELINLLRARSFGNLGFAYFEADGRRVYLNLRLSDSIHFE